MRIGIISDIHGNYAALRSVLDDMGEVDAIWCLGDLVGYGPQPNECIEALRELPHVCTPGNHDWGTLGRLNRHAFNRDARTVLEWTYEALTPDNCKYLEGLPLQMTALQSSFTLVHASPRDPMWEYLLDLFDAAECFARFDSRYCLVGHTHVPLIFIEASPGDSGSAAKGKGTVRAEIPEVGQAIEVDISPYRGTGDLKNGDFRMIINPGSVGQPRDGDPRAAYMMLEMPNNVAEQDRQGWRGKLTFHRVEYPISETQQIMQKKGFPPRLISRLGIGV